MRYRQVTPRFWTGDTARWLRGEDPWVRVVAMYLITGPHSHPTGLYYLPLPTLAHEIGSPLEGASKGLRRLSEGGFCTYDATREVVFVHEMARFQVAESLKPTDNKVKMVATHVQEFENTPLFAKWCERYHAALSCPFEAPSKPLRSQEQEQEQDQDQEQDILSGSDPPAKTNHPAAEPARCPVSPSAPPDDASDLFSGLPEIARAESSRDAPSMHGERRMVGSSAPPANEIARDSGPEKSRGAPSKQREKRAIEVSAEYVTRHLNARHGTRWQPHARTVLRAARKWRQWGWSPERALAVMEQAIAGLKATCRDWPNYLRPRTLYQENRMLAAAEELDAGHRYAARSPPAAGQTRNPRVGRAEPAPHAAFDQEADF